MFAVVARTRSIPGAPATPCRAVRVTHALLFVVALIVSPGVCGACAAGCRASGPSRLGSSVGTGVAFFTSPADDTCGGCPVVGSVGCPLDGTAADRTGCCPARCRGGPDCGCLLEPADEAVVILPVTARKTTGDGMPVAWCEVCDRDTARTARLPAPTHDRPPDRPARVLYGVWRN